MPFDHSKLIGLIVEKYGTRAAFAEAMDYTKGQLSRRLNNLTAFDTEDIKKAQRLLDIAPENIGVYFFTPKVR